MELQREAAQSQRLPGSRQEATAAPSVASKVQDKMRWAGDGSIERYPTEIRTMYSVKRAVVTLRQVR